MPKDNGIWPPFAISLMRGREKSFMLTYAITIIYRVPNVPVSVLCCGLSCSFIANA